MKCVFQTENVLCRCVTTWIIPQDRLDWLGYVGHQVRSPSSAMRRTTFHCLIPGKFLKELDFSGYQFLQTRSVVRNWWFSDDTWLSPPWVRNSLYTFPIALRISFYQKAKLHFTLASSHFQSRWVGCKTSATMLEPMCFVKIGSLYLIWWFVWPSWKLIISTQSWFSSNNYVTPVICKSM